MPPLDVTLSEILSTTRVLQARVSTIFRLAVLASGDGEQPVAEPPGVPLRPWKRLRGVVRHLVVVRHGERAQIHYRDGVVGADDERALRRGVDREAGGAESHGVRRPLEADGHAIERPHAHASVRTDQRNLRRREAGRGGCEQQRDAERVDDGGSGDDARERGAVDDVERLRIDDDSRARRHEDPAARQPRDAAGWILDPKRDDAERPHPLDIDDPHVARASRDRDTRSAR
jgi:hypothetical protein